MRSPKPMTRTPPRSPPEAPRGTRAAGSAVRAALPSPRLIPPPDRRLDGGGAPVERRAMNDAFAHLPVDPHLYAGFLGVMMVMAITPGPANLFAVATGVSKGKAAAMAGVVGMNAATLVWFGAAALGLGALVLAFPAAVRVIAIGGALYVAWLGFQSLRGAFAHGRRNRETATRLDPAQRPGGRLPGPDRQSQGRAVLHRRPAAVPGREPPDRTATAAVRRRHHRHGCAVDDRLRPGRGRPDPADDRAPVPTGFRHRRRPSAAGRRSPDRDATYRRLAARNVAVHLPFSAKGAYMSSSRSFVMKHPCPSRPVLPRRC